MSKLQPMKLTIPMQSANGTHARGFCFSDSLEEEARFVWDGSHLLQEIHSDGRYTYIDADQDSYEPLAQVRDWTTEDGESRQQTHYFHCDQIGIPREMTDKDGNLLWFGNYTGWGHLKEETRVTDSAYQPFRLHKQYADRKTGLHYNFFSYYEPDAGRFVNQDPIGLSGGENLYAFALNIQGWVDTLGLAKNRGRVQAQGTHLEESVSWDTDEPVTVKDVQDKLEELKRKLSKRDLKDRKEAFEKAKNFIENGNNCNGLDAPISKTFMVKGTKHERVDIEILSGRIDPNS